MRALSLSHILTQNLRLPHSGGRLYSWQIQQRTRKEEKKQIHLPRQTALVFVHFTVVIRPLVVATLLLICKKKKKENITPKTHVQIENISVANCANYHRRCKDAAKICAREASRRQPLILFACPTDVSLSLFSPAFSANYQKRNTLDRRKETKYENYKERGREEDEEGKRGRC